MKLCKDCRFVRLHAISPGQYSECLKGVTQNPVTGVLDLPTQSTIHASLLRQRTSPTDCGPDARFFQHAKLAIVTTSEEPA